MTVITQSSFAAGEVSPELHGRVDQTLYHIGLAKAENMVVRQTGGIYNRGGLRYIGNIKNHGQGARLIQFKFSAEDTYVLELGHRYIRFIRNDAHVAEGGKAITDITKGATTTCRATSHGYETGDDVYISGVGGMLDINERWFSVVKINSNQFRLRSQVDDSEIVSTNYGGYTSGGKAYKIYEISTPYDFDDLDLIKYAQSGDVVTLVHPGYPAAELKRMGHTDWGLEKIIFNSVIEPPVFLGSPTLNNPGTLADNIDFIVTSVDGDGVESTPGLTYAGYGVLGLSVSQEVVTVTYGDLINVGKPDHLAGENRMISTTPLYYDDTSDYKFPGIKNGDQIYISGLPGIPVLNNKYFVIENLNLSTKTFVLSGVTSLEGASYAAGGKIYPAFVRRIWSGTPSSTSKWYIYVIPQDGISFYKLYYRRGNNEFIKVLENTAVNVNTSSNSSYVYFNMWRSPASGGGGTTDVSLNSILPDDGSRPPSANFIFAKEDEYPSAVGFYQQRRIFGAANNNPDKLYYSEIGDYLLFTEKTKLLEDDDPIVATLASGEVNNIQHLVSLSDLLVLTDSTQWQVRANIGSAFTARSIEQRPQTRVGSSSITPIVFDDLVIYAREGNRSIIGLGYNNDRDGYVPTELSLLSNHLFLQSPVIDTAALTVPSKQLICVLADGSVGYLTFNAEQKVTAWTPWRTNGLFESVAVARPGGSTGAVDAAYFVVQRIIDGRVVRYIERTSSRQFTDIQDCYFVDAGLTYDNPIEVTDVATGGTTTITTAVAHGLSVGYEINFSDIQWAKKYDEFFTEIPLNQLNNYKYKVKSVPSTTTFTLGNFDDNANIDSSEFTRYLSKGKVRSMIQTLRSLWYLEGEKVAVLADGNSLLDLVVENGSITLPYRYGRVHIGLPYVSEVETLPLALEDPSVRPVPKDLTKVLMRLYRSGTILLAPKDGDFYTLPLRNNEVWGEAVGLFTGSVDISTASQWEISGAFTVRQKDPLPMGILSMSPIFALGDAE